FRDGNTSEASVPAAPDGAAADGHAGGDEGLMRAFAASLRAGGPDGHLVSARESLESHRLTFAAERARLTGSVVEFDSERNVTQA
ncbi:MAG TPA: gfo/Idh/MocA family oxidoreductase, partial [Segeticoccus sp.]|nr:gfo/Idh/MocA family oxidoreductase [Segeticoccus sp.]